MLIMVLKTKPNWPVQPIQLGTGFQSDLVMGKNQKSIKNWENLETGRVESVKGWLGCPLRCGLDTDDFAFAFFFFLAPLALFMGNEQCI